MRVEICAWGRFIDNPSYLVPSELMNSRGGVGSRGCIFVVGSVEPASFLVSRIRRRKAEYL